MPERTGSKMEVGGETSSELLHDESFLHSLMRRQLRLSIGCGLAFLSMLLGLPLLNYFTPGFMATQVGGFTLTWLVLGVLFFPFVWAIAYFFIRKTIALEKAEVSEVTAKIQIQTAKANSDRKPQV